VHRLRYTAPRGADRGDPRFVTRVNGTLVYVSYFIPSNSLFTRWMLDGSQTGGVTRSPAPFDPSSRAELHSVSHYDSSLRALYCPQQLLHLLASRRSAPPGAPTCPLAPGSATRRGSPGPIFRGATTCGSWRLKRRHTACSGNKGSLTCCPCGASLRPCARGGMR